MVYIIGILLFLIILIIAVLLLRKNIYGNVDQLEKRKQDIMNRNIAEELQRIKGLNLFGETQTKFEGWKEQWENIVAKELPDIEEFLFDAENAADKYRFNYAKKIIKQADMELLRIEDTIETMLKDLDLLLDSEKTSRIDVEQIQPEIKQLKKNLFQNRYKYGKAEAQLEIEIETLNQKLRDYDELTTEGNYLDAKELVDIIKGELAELSNRIETFPTVYKACKHDLSAQLDDLLAGIQEMKRDGYRVEHLGFEKEIYQYYDRLTEYMEQLENAKVEEAESFVAELDTRIKEMYQLLEKEAIAKNYVLTKIPVFKGMIQEFDLEFADTKVEVDELKNAYYFEDSDLDKYISLEKATTKMYNQLTAIETDVENDDILYSNLRATINSGFELIESLQKDHERFKEQIQNLRKDELVAKEKLADMKGQINDVMRRLYKSNIPGVPAFIWKNSEAANEANTAVLDALKKQPLDIVEVQGKLEKAQTVVQTLIDETEQMLENAYLTERVIQYANRYRSRNHVLQLKLDEAEQLFRTYEYELALETAAKALELAEPGVLKRLEAFEKMPNQKMDHSVHQ